MRKRLRTRSTTLRALALLVAAAGIAVLVGALASSGGAKGDKTVALKGTSGEPDAAATKPGLAANSWEDYLAAAEAYPGANVTPADVARARATFERIAARDGGHGVGRPWERYGPLVNAFQPGVLAFSGAPNTTASRTTALLISSRCQPGDCRLWAGTAGGGVWRTDNALAPEPVW